MVWYAGVGLAQAGLAFWVLWTQPRRPLNWVVGTLLLFWAASGVLFQLMREAPDTGTFLVYHWLGSYLESPAFLLVLLLADQMLLPRPRPRLWAGVLLLAAMVWLVIVFAHVWGPSIDPGQVVVTSGRIARWTPTSPQLLNACLNMLSQAVVVVLAARAASTGGSPLRRRQAALVGLAFALPLTQAGTGFSVEFSGWKGATNVMGYVGLLAAAYALPRLGAPFRGFARVAVVGSIVLTGALGFIAHNLYSLFAPFGVRVVALSAFALILAVAILRYDLADRGVEGTRRVQTTAAVLLGLLATAILGGAAWSLGGLVPTVLVAMLAPVAMLATPLKAFPSWVTRRVLLPPRHPDVLRERVRIYTGVLRAVAGPEGRVPDPMQPTLAALRAEMGLSRRDHDLLVAMGRDPEGASLVAYRLAFARETPQPPEASEMQRLRDELGLTERHHALVMEDLRTGGDTLAEGDVFLDRYRLARRLGEGAFGEVWLAEDERIGRRVVLKRLGRQEARDARALLRVQREVHASSALDHPRIVTVHGVEVVKGETYLVMEHLSGGSLAEKLRSNGRLPERDVALLALDVLAALDALHARGIVHRDVKPGNILLDGEGRAKLGDFTIAREFVSGETVGPEGPRGPIGTFPYMPPEQARGLAARPPADCYALAATMCEALSGRPVFEVEGLSHHEAARRIVQDAPTLPSSHASSAMRAVLERALAKAPEDRFQGAARMADAILDTLSAPLPLTLAGTPAGSDRSPPRPPASARPDPDPHAAN